MGLSVGVGVLAELLENDEEGGGWLREELALANRVLAASGLPPHEEPEELRVESRAGVDGVPYGFLHTLRRAYAHSLLNPSSALKPLREDEDAAKDPLVGRASTPASHLLYHSDAEGLYVPVDFEQVLEHRDLAGVFLGSSQRLLGELTRVAPLLSIAMAGRELPDESVASMERDPDDAPFFRERLIWLILFEAARLSVEHRTAIVFG
jgi:hypothetical protein